MTILPFAEAVSSPTFTLAPNPGRSNDDELGVRQLTLSNFCLSSAIVAEKLVSIVTFCSGERFGSLF